MKMTISKYREKQESRNYKIASSVNKVVGM